MNTSPVSLYSVRFQSLTANKPDKKSGASEIDFSCKSPASASFLDDKALNPDIKSLYHPGGISFTGLPLNIKHIKTSEVSSSLVTEVGAYRSRLAETLGVKIDCLKSILEPEELKEILKFAKPENFSVGENFKNILDGTFNINLHMHTKHSDGKMSVKELLEQAVKYAQYRKTLNKTDPVIVAVTDHDKIDGPKEVARIIASNPELYKDIRVVLGAEFNVSHQTRQLEAIAYCINPFDKGLNTFVDCAKDANKEYLESFLKTHVNEWEAKAGIPVENRTTLEKIIKHSKDNNLFCCHQIEILGSPGLMRGFISGLKDIFAKRGWKMDGIHKFEEEHCQKYKSIFINPGSPELSVIPRLIKASGSGFVGISHPCRNLGGMDLRYLFSDFKEMGIDAAEVNYQYLVNELYFPKSFQDHANLAASLNNMIKSGGSDNHTDNIFTNIINKISLPEQVQKIIK